MPQLDQTGPEGKGAMTGRRAGRCTNFGAGKAKKGAGSQANEDDTRQGTSGRGQGAGGGRGQGG
ncbi:MAG TPA: DUF5320 domain-containing protein, partial [Bacteroidales bacterium]|nr:DUF5320 domain-containing protein [Bacteroidales bacterium]HPJ06191.1 DUF5320 domain-containing protein [Bacteroidales bacterium]HPQ64876.1 DUF5320 domain-containing protein [Bacteroidales bacterium]